ncbi:replication initiation protein [Campylobacter cuniculorum]|uniref:Replication protein B n=1 Tax=Campylobacter cuniculorum DSM 23162 = LMG 24588 TaxID=1121267 RepID=A0A1W6BZE1_9BACT|nr:replication initiation protein [Campylobacter cuniculorum]ARJ57458.1 replication protein B [Campylobacter cuniculorum DSM 23162 = LMG 24588]
MNEIVKYHNDFNKIQLPNFNEIEQNLLCFLLTKIKEKQKNEMITLYPKDLTGFSEKNLSNREVTEILNSFENKFFKADFTIILKDEVRNLIGKMRVNLFNYFVIWKKWRDKYNMELGILDAWEEFTHIEIQVNEHFEYLVNQLTANFTAFELTEFIALSGKYTKTLYRLLKQYRATGKVYFKWEEFCKIMDIPENYRQSEVDKKILNPAIKELSKERNLFDQKRTPFKNLTYEKEKQKGTRGRGGKVSGIIFTFTPESILMQKLEKESEKIETPEQKYFKILNNMRQNQVRFIYKNQLWQFNDFNFDEFKIIAVELIRDEYENLNFRNHKRFTAKSQEQFFEMIDTFRNQIR